jgi:transcriptional regulator with XRE-family HTH domain
MAERDITSEPFPQQLRLYRERKRLSQSKFAILCFLDHSYVSRLENSTRKPARDVTFLMADELSLTVDERRHFIKAAGYAVPTDPDGQVAILGGLLNSPKISYPVRQRVLSTVNLLCDYLIEIIEK